MPGVPKETILVSKYYCANMAHIYIYMKFRKSCFQKCT